MINSASQFFIGPVLTITETETEGAKRVCANRHTAGPDSEYCSGGTPPG